jgi:rhamnulokinase
MNQFHLAIDLGAESGRLMLGTLADGKVSLAELHRFPNTPLRIGDSLHWNIEALFAEVKVGLRKAAALKIPFASISTDSWGLDYVLFDAAGGMISPTFHYRDPRTARGVDRVRKLVSWPEVFAETGLQFMPINTIYQLASETPERMRAAKQLLPIADAFNFLLCGVARAEESLASTTQLYNPRTRDWSARLLNVLELPRDIFPPIVPSGTVLGSLQPELARELGLPPMPVIASCSHDTGAAVAAVPACGEDWAYLSSGTWSLLGAELSSPLLTDQCREFNCTNEIGYGRSVRLLKNIVGLWIVQECRREWARGGTDFDYATLMKLAADAPPFISLINPDDPRFVAPGDMPGKIAAFCRETGQPEPSTPGATVRCVLESLALLYARVLKKLETLTGKKFTRLHIVGGGSRNELLNQLTANALGESVLAGPVEATALGNVLVQSLALGGVSSLAAARELVANSFPLTRYEPRDRAVWISPLDRRARNAESPC